MAGEKLNQGTKLGEKKGKHEGYGWRITGVTKGSENGSWGTLRGTKGKEDGDTREGEKGGSQRTVTMPVSNQMILNLSALNAFFQDMRWVALLILSMALWLSAKTAVQLVMEEGERVVSTLAVKETMVDAVGALVGQLVEQRFIDCHIMLISQATPSAVVNVILRHITAKVGTSVVVVTGGEQDLQQSVRGNTLTTCRALIICFNDQVNTTNTTDIFRY
ncbi:hypothetical protein Pcinc_025849 [Petrolisthes cinctipes]|uniref:Uncharacterized protein n=1 Tax=Petrolisthes cinctipes TaxID=88211 RepID=A0AAE1F803_PETCI|nr:hypothetical protein Pcinc_025849 [Petrolisthes cinctipes]